MSKLNWNYNPENYVDENENSAFEVLPEGKYQVRIDNIAYQQTNSGKDMYKITLAVLDSSAKLRYFLVLNPDNQKFTDFNLGRIYDSFRITEEARSDTESWVGSWGAAEIKHNNVTKTKDDGSTYTITFMEVKRFIKHEEQIELGWAVEVEEIPF